MYSFCIFPSKWKSICIENAFFYTDKRFDLNVSRLTATKYLDALADGGFLKKQKIGRANYYINLALTPILQREP